MSESKNNSNNFRFERKFVVDSLSKPEIEALVKLHPAVFSEIFYERLVNNIYLDSCSLQNYFANIDGLHSRRKCRIRWYGDLFGHIEKPVLELKIKEGLLGRKESYPLPSFSLDENFQLNAIREVFKKSEIPAPLVDDLLSLQPALLNRYSRRYFQSADRNYRITIDSQMEYYRIDPHSNSFLQRMVDGESVIVELKYNHDQDNFAQMISTHFPYRMTKSSKYVNGVQKLYL
ncbi:polyphosphate polymerase domain-containing protein [candidate division KSB1 bacterium]|nr:polyphosphate polymerase domain-containing protein [candidate division KSB1 bacterium]NIR69707.1 polyphosphate polymerase domain-containing protein [candidate division KSB1 bacterium]NIS24903.1 polyphosphate polymerase domain-containing protein [candidate division KSB1 bacterium]NIT69752.1 polyphosphate polymerase domain-containing protein [candidate division KSB1 bacterium]NIU23422.1 polyphosphate polymerase domain-containing protein [candidate division KSB1 bacterium]